MHACTIADLSRNLRFACRSGVDMMQIMKGVVCLTLGSTMRPRLPTSLCFRTFCSRYLRFLSVFAPCMTTYMFIRSTHQLRGNAWHGKGCASIRRKQKKEIGVDLVLDRGVKLCVHAPAASLKPSRAGGSPPAEHPAPPPPGNAAPAASAPLRNWTWRARSAPAPSRPARLLDGRCRICHLGLASGKRYW